MNERGRQNDDDTRKQRRCAMTVEGHRFPNGADGTCPRCGLVVVPPGRGGGERVAA